MGLVRRLFALAIGLSFSFSGARADFSPVIEHTTTGTGFLIGTGAVVGYSFSIGSSAVTIDAVGLEFQGTAQTGQVRIYQIGSNTDILTATVSASPVSSTTSFSNKYSYVSVAPTVLNAGATYAIVWDLPSNSAVVDYQTPATSHNANVTFVGGIASVSANSHPTGDLFGSGGGYYGPAFEIVTAAVPEPSSVILMGCAGLFGSSAGWRAFVRRSRMSSQESSTQLS